MMKRLVVLSFVALLAMSAFGCPGNNNNVNTGPMNQSQTAKWVKNQMANDGFDVDVYVQDVDKNGLEDYVIVLNSVTSKEDKSLLDFLISVTVYVGIANSNISWQSDKVFVKVGDEVVMTTAAGLQRCVDLVAAEASNDEVAQCMMDAWVPEGEGGQPAETSQPTNYKDMPL